MTHEKVLLENFNTTFGAQIELSSVALGGKITCVSDDFFAAAYHLLLVEPAPSLKGQFGPNGALFSGWESRRHNPTYDWCIIKLGAPGNITGFDVDTSHFNGNEAPEVSVEALFAADGEADPLPDDERWAQVLTRVPLGPDSRHLFSIATSPTANYVKLNMYPDGGIARFRVYGTVTPAFPPNAHEEFDLAHVFSGGRVVFTSDQHFGVGSNLIIPGRGKDMGDGWETKRSRQPGHRDWAIIKLGDGGYLTHVEIDTAHFKGNFPESCELYAINSPDFIPPHHQGTPGATTESSWAMILPRSKLGPHRQHFFQLQNVDHIKYTHVMLTIYPDGGIKRVRVLGTHELGRNSGSRVLTSSAGETPATGGIQANPWDDVPSGREVKTLRALPLLPEIFAAFGQVIQGYDLSAVPRDLRVTGANQGSAHKFHKISLLESSYPKNVQATTGLSVYRCQPIDAKSGGYWDIKVLERHLHTNQAFIPMCSGSPSERGQGLKETATGYLVVVAQNGKDDRPDLGTMRAFIASSAQGIVYNTGIWHHPMAVLEKPMDLTCVETQIGDGGKLDCEIVNLDTRELVYRVTL
ncbi:allantoicase [Thelephora terrestris]|uniref:Allantoicase n=1 Tax=Thelephora terrestris TaxID=56493 RepID=A0A9P6HU10_9AGAM|nr:allantoicase [Thelephora terrestris]